MDKFSDDEKVLEVDIILNQRKRKGILEYLVKWKDADSEQDTSWEPAESLASSCAEAIKSFIKSKTQKRAQSKTRKSSRSRSRSSSRSRKTTVKTTPKRSARSRSRGGRLSKTPKTPVEEQKPAEEEKSEEKPAEVTEKPVAEVTEKPAAEVTEKPAAEVIEKPAVEITEKPAAEVIEVPIVEITKKSEEKTETEVVNSASVSETISSSSTVTQSESNMAEMQEGEVNRRVLRSSTMAAREKLEVQRVHNEQRPVHKDDDKPRSSIWKVADYAVIALFVLSVFAALFLFVEKFVNLDDFKPNFSLLKTRMVSLVQEWIDCVSDCGLWMLDKIGAGGAKEVPAKEVPAKA